MTMQAQHGDGISGLALGVTGHRDPRDVDAVIHALGGVFRAVAEGAVLSTALADGVDQVAAEVALFCGVGIRVVLPMPIEVYRQTLSAVARFDQLCAKACEVVELPRRATDSDERCYRRLGAYLATRLDVVLICSDGHPAMLPGGTAEVAHFARYGPLEELVTDLPGDDSAHRPVCIEIRTPRLSRAAVNGVPAGWSHVLGADYGFTDPRWISSHRWMDILKGGSHA